MGQWENNFAKRMSQLNDTSATRFGNLADAEIGPAFAGIESFVTTGGFTVVAHEDGHQDRSYRFSLTDKLSVNVVFSLDGPCQARSSYQIETGDGTHDSVLTDTVPLTDMTEGWARCQFQHALDAFMAEIESLKGGDEAEAMYTCGADPASGQPDRPTADVPSPEL